MEATKVLDGSRKGNTDAILGWNAPHIHITAAQLADQPKVEWETVTEVVNGCRYTFDRKVAK